MSKEVARNAQVATTKRNKRQLAAGARSVATRAASFAFTTRTVGSPKATVTATIRIRPRARAEGTQE